MEDTDPRALAAKRQSSRPIDLKAIDALARQAADIEAPARPMKKQGTPRDKETSRPTRPAAESPSDVGSASTVATNESAQTVVSTASLDQASTDTAAPVLVLDQGVTVGERQKSIPYFLLKPDIEKKRT